MCAVYMVRGILSQNVIEYFHFLYFFSLPPHAYIILENPRQRKDSLLCLKYFSLTACVPS